jgi:CRP/FNR family cyclic AMP-dependent transcriptional regulator
LTSKRTRPAKSRADCFLRARAAYFLPMEEKRGQFRRANQFMTLLPEEFSSGLFAKAARVKLAADELLFSAGDEGNGCYRIESGILKLSILSTEGDERILDILGPGCVVGELSMIDAAPRATAVYAVRDAELSFISRGAFLAFAERHPELYRHITSLLAQRVREMNDVAVAWSFLPLEGRVAYALLELAEACGEEIDGGRMLIKQKVEQSDIAAMAGMARENASRILNKLIRDKFLSRHAGYYCIEAYERMETLAGK